MRTTIDIPEDLMERVRRITGATTKRGAVLGAMEALVRQNKQAEFRARIGTFDLGMTREELLRWRRMD